MLNTSTEEIWVGWFEEAAAAQADEAGPCSFYAGTIITGGCPTLRDFRSVGTTEAGWPMSPHEV